MRLAPVAIAGLFVLAVAPVVYLAITLGRALDGQLTIQPALHLVMTLASLVGLVVFVVLISRDRRLDGHRLPWILALLLLQGVAGAAYLIKYHIRAERGGQPAGTG